MSAHRIVCVTGIAAMLAAVALPAFAQWAPDVNGYSQFRYEYSDADSDGDFDTRRVRLNWKDQINDLGTTVRVQLDFSDLLSGDGNEVNAKDIWVMHPFSEDWSGLVGFTTVRFGYELEYSSSKRLPLERSQAARSFFPGERGLGVYLGHAGSEDANVNADLCYVDGMDSWERGDFDDAESLLARAEVPFGNSSVAGV
ncbi:MAG: porin, partial [Armatimonadota bacterium]